MVKRRRRKKSKGKEQKIQHRKPGYYWILISNGGIERWIIGRWWQSLQFFDTMGTIADKGWRDKIIKVDETRIKRVEKTKRVKRVRTR